MPGFVQLTSQVPERDGNDLAQPGTVNWSPERKVVYATCVQAVEKWDLLTFDTGSLPLRDLTSFDIDHPWNFVLPSRVAYDQAEVFTVSYTTSAGAREFVPGEVITQVTLPATGVGVLYNYTVDSVDKSGSIIRTGQITFRESTAGFANGDTVTNAIGQQFTFGSDLAPHTRYMGSIWTHGVAQQRGSIGERIPVLTRGFTKVACLAGTAASQYLVPNEDLPEVRAKALSTDPIMVVGKSLNEGRDADGNIFVLFNGERGHGTSAAYE